MRYALSVCALVLITACSSPPATVPSTTAAAAAPPPSSSPTVCAVPPHQATGPVLFSSDMSARCTGRVFGSVAGGAASGSATADLTGYRVIMNGPDDFGAGPDVADYPVAKSPDNVRGEVDAEEVRGSDKVLVGFECRVQFDTRGRVVGGYRLLIARSGGYLIERFGESPQVLTSGTSTTTLGSSNHIMAECLGNKLALSVNGKEVASVQDSAISTGLIGIYAHVLDATAAELVFKNFVVTGP